MEILKGESRAKLYKKVMPWYDCAPIGEETGLPLVDQTTPYAMYKVQEVNPALIQEMEAASVEVGKLVLAALPLIRQLDTADLLSLGFPELVIKAMRHDEDPPLCLRLDWCWGDRKAILEINAQTPSFLVESLLANKVAAEHFGKSWVTPGAETTVRANLDGYLQLMAKKLGKPLRDCRIAFTALNNVEDMGTIKYLRSLCCYESEFFPLEYLRIDSECVYNVWREQPIDILFCWYPLEWLINDRADDGSLLWPKLEALVLANKLAVPNLISGFTMQPKSVFALIQQIGYTLFKEGLEYLPKTCFDLQELGTSTYFAKPILGRQGDGVSYVKDGKVELGATGPEWYKEQELVYQEALTLPTFPALTYGTLPMTALYGSWLWYNEYTKSYESGGIGLRVSESLITGDTAYYLPIGL